MSKGKGKGNKESKANGQAPPEGEEVKSIEKMSDDRAEIMRKAADRRRREVEGSREAYGEGENKELIDAMDREIRGETPDPRESGGDRGGEGDREAKAGAKAIADQQRREAKPEKAEKPEPKGDGEDVAPEMVEVVVFGKTRQVPKTDVDRAGGISAYQKNAAATERLRNAAQLEARIAARQREVDEREKKLKQREDAAAKEQASRSASDEEPLTSTGQEPPDKGAHPQPNAERVKRIVDGMYSGDEGKATEAISEILAERDRQNQPPLSAEAVADLVVQRLEAQRGKGDEPERRQATSTESAFEAQLRAEVNQVMEDEFSDVLNDADMLALSRHRFNQLRTAPENRFRQWTDIARDAGEYARRKFGHDAQIERRRDEKRTLPAESRASAAKAAEEEKRPPTRSEHVKRLRQNAGLER